VKKKPGHRGSSNKVPRTLGPDAPTLAPSATSTGRRLDLACGQVPIDGFEGVDIWPGAKHVVNLMEYPWPFADGSCAELYSSHFVEHIPMIYVDDSGKEVPMGTPGARDALFRFFDECWRVLEMGGTMKVIVPNARSNRGFMDPTHRRFFVGETFLYVVDEWRKMNKLDHYNVKCNFKTDVVHSYDSSLNLKTPEVLAEWFNTRWNLILDWHATLTKIPEGALASAPPTPAITMGR
jgi:predicted SAM-dependent methyltransferase